MGPVGTEDHYFTAAPTSPGRHGRVELHTPQGTVELRTSDGTFSPGRVDPGTRVLLDALPRPADWPAGPVLDVGCGYGPIAAWLALADPDREVWAVDVNERAVADCRHNAEELGLSITVSDPTEVPDDLRFAAIVSNPPVRIGKAALDALLDHWLDRLADGGEAWLVVGRHLGADSLARRLVESGWEVERIRSRRSYRVLLVRRTGSTGS